MLRKEELLGDPELTPFVRYDHGTPLYPPNNLYECAQTVLEALATEDVASTFGKLIQKGSYMGQYGVLPNFYVVRGIGKLLSIQNRAPPRQFTLDGVLHLRTQINDAKATSDCLAGSEGISEREPRRDNGMDDVLEAWRR